jgi:hypothetical protein
MHIHSSPMNSQMMGATQGTQQAVAARREAMAVRKKLTDFAASVDNEDVARVAGDSDADPDSQSRQRKNQQSEAESFKSVYFSFTV